MQRASETSKIGVLFGPPGMGKNYIGNFINNNFPEYVCIDGDTYVSEEGHLRHQNGTWNNNDRRSFITAMAAGVTETAKRTKTIVATAMTTQWMRDYFMEQVQLFGDWKLAWILVKRELSEAEINSLIEERRNEGHILNSRDAFNRFTGAFERPSMMHYELINPGPQADHSALVLAINNTLTQIYGN